MVLDDLADWLTSCGGITTTIYRGFMPEQPDEALQILETGGLAPVYAMASAAGKAVEERPTVQIVRRSLTYQAARVEMNTIFRTLDGHPGRTVNGVAYKQVVALQSPFALGRDESNRPLIACNFAVFKALTTATST